MTNSCEHMNAVVYSNERKSAQNNSFTFTHLRPLSIYSHMVCRSQFNPSSPLCNIQVQITNKTSSKRRLEDSCLDETCETPLKKPRLYQSCSPDQGCVLDSLDFLTGTPVCTPVQTLKISKDVMPPGSKVVQPVTPVMSTPLFHRRLNRLDQAWESLPSPIPSPIPGQNRNRDGSSSKVSLNFRFCNSVSVFLTGCQGSGKGEVREVSHAPVHEWKHHSVTPEFSAAGRMKEKGSVSVHQQMKCEVSALNQDSTENLPHHVQVKSKVLVPLTTKTVSQSADSHKKPECVINRRTHQTELRPVLSYSEEVWQREQMTYVESVKRHMREGNRAGNGVMTELHHLMNTVAGQHSGGNREPWQHPSDLTHRNYRSCVRGPLLSLSEWQNKNFLNQRRFSRVPDVFRRSPVL